MGKRIEDYKHINSGRLNNPDVGLVNSTNDSDSSKRSMIWLVQMVSSELQKDIKWIDLQNLVKREWF